MTQNRPAIPAFILVRYDPRQAKVRKPMTTQLQKLHDRARRDRDMLGRQLRILVDTYSSKDPATDAPVIQSARATLEQIYGPREKGPRRWATTKAR